MHTAATDAWFPDAVARVARDRLLDDRLLAARGRVATGSVAPTTSQSDAAAALAGFDFTTPMAFTAVADWVIGQLEHGVTHTTHPRYLGLFNPAPSHPAECADRIAAQFNPQLASATTSPAAVAIEAHVIRSFTGRIGWSDAAGHFTTGGSDANFTALICALLQADGRYATGGARVFAGAPVFYVSADAHLAWHKIAVQAGLGSSAMRLVDTDPSGRMNADALRARITADRAAGLCPVMIAATAGTTGAGMVDPLRACASVAADAGVWFHVDAAWGGALLASPRLAVVLDGIDLAQSVTIDAHKFMATTMGCGMFLTRMPQLLSQAFQVATVFMTSNDALVDPYVTSLQWSRRFLGLRLFMALAQGGWAALAAHVDHAAELADRLAARLHDAGWSVVNGSAMAVLCAVPPPGAPAVRSIVRDLVESGVAWVSVTRFGGRDVLRACITNGRTTDGDLAVLVSALCRIAAPRAVPAVCFA